MISTEFFTVTNRFPTTSSPSHTIPHPRLKRNRTLHHRVRVQLIKPRVSSSSRGKMAADDDAKTRYEDAALGMGGKKRDILLLSAPFCLD